MRLLAVLIAVAALAACALSQTGSEQALLRYNDEWRNRQAALDADAILKGMAQARHNQAELARSAP